MQLVNTVNKTYLKGLLARGAACLYSFQTYLQGIVGPRCSLFISFPNLPPGEYKSGCSLFIWFPNLPLGDCWPRYSLFIWFPDLPPGDCWPELQHVYMVSQPTCKGLLARRAACLYRFRTYLQGIVGQSWSLSMWFLTYIQGIVRFSCLCSFQTYLWETVWLKVHPVNAFLKPLPGNCWPGCILFIWYLNLPPGDFEQGCKLFKGFLN